MYKINASHNFFDDKSLREICLGAQSEIAKSQVDSEQANEEQQAVALA